MSGMGRTAFALILVAAAAIGAGAGMYMLLNATFDGADVIAYTDDGVSVSVSGDFRGNTVLTADTSDGRTFKGWYDADGKLLSSESRYKAKMSDGDVICAYSTSYVTVNSEEDVDLAALLNLSGGTVRILASDSGGTASFNGTTAVFPLAGTYMVLYTDDDNGIHRCLQILADGDIQMSYEWAYTTTVTPQFNPWKRWFPSTSEVNFNLTLVIRYSDYIHYVDAYAPDDRYSYYSNESGSDEDIAHDLSFVRYDSTQDPYIQAIADYIETKTAGKSQQYTANVILGFVQSIPYAYDSDIHGRSEYWQFPLETLFLNSGDCEDTSILFCAIASTMGYDSSLFMFRDHMASGIALDSFTATRNHSASVQSGVYGWKLQTGTDGNGDAVMTGFYYGETTTEGWLIGEIPSAEYSKYIRGFYVPART